MKDSGAAAPTWRRSAIASSATRRSTRAWCCSTPRSAPAAGRSCRRSSRGCPSAGPARSRATSPPIASRAWAGGATPRSSGRSPRASARRPSHGGADGVRVVRGNPRRRPRRARRLPAHAAAAAALNRIARRGDRAGASSGACPLAHRAQRGEVGLDAEPGRRVERDAPGGRRASGGQSSVRSGFSFESTSSRPVARRRAASDVRRGEQADAGAEVVRAIAQACRGDAVDDRRARRRRRPTWRGRAGRRRSRATRSARRTHRRRSCSRRRRAGSALPRRVAAIRRQGRSARSGSSSQARGERGELRAIAIAVVERPGLVGVDHHRRVRRRPRRARRRGCRRRAPRRSRPSA